jgi:hypothetical protein
MSHQGVRRRRVLMNTIGIGNQSVQTIVFLPFVVFTTEDVRAGFVSNFFEVLNNKTEVKNSLDKLFD